MIKFLENVWIPAASASEFFNLGCFGSVCRRVNEIDGSGPRSTLCRGALAGVSDMRTALNTLAVSATSNALSRDCDQMGGSTGEAPVLVTKPASPSTLPSSSFRCHSSPINGVLASAMSKFCRKLSHSQNGTFHSPNHTGLISFSSCQSGYTM